METLIGIIEHNNDEGGIFVTSPHSTIVVCFANVVQMESRLFNGCRVRYKGDIEIFDPLGDRATQ